MDLFLTNTQLFTSQYINWGTGVVWITCGLLWCFYQLFGLSFWRHPFTSEDPLVSKWCNAKFLQICSDDKLIYILDGMRASKFSAKFHFWMSFTLIFCISCYFYIICFNFNVSFSFKHFVKCSCHFYLFILICLYIFFIKFSVFIVLANYNNPAYIHRNHRNTSCLKDIRQNYFRNAEKKL